VPHVERDLSDTLPAGARADRSDHVRRLIVIGRGEASVHALPAAGSILLGRSSFADIVLDDPSISRRHAMVSIDAGRVTIEDLGSANGTRIGDLNLKPGSGVGVLPGEPIELGAITVILARGTPSKLEDEADCGVVLADRKMKEIQDLIQKIAPSNLSVLLLGETGVGKEVLARRVHERSGRSGPFVALNCSALSESLLESELFGHEEGAFTGAVRQKQGLLQSAEGGTVLLDEVGELSLAIQVKLLRVIESKQVTRLGALSPQQIDVRFVSATNRDLEVEVEAGRFRRDLFFRLAGMTISVPPLRERAVEIEPLVRSFLRSAARESGRAEPQISSAAMQLLSGHSWPGNVRELKSTVERALLLAEEEIRVEHLQEVQSAARPRKTVHAPGGPLKSEVRALEKEAIMDALDRSGGNQSAAAKLLGISRRTLGDRMDAFGIQRPRKKNRMET
jgi:transcriptional regulator with PAS, ATPase and Fis domain